MPAELTETLESQLKDWEHAALIDFGKPAELAIKLLVKRYPQYMDKTGIVLAGFGDNDYFPAYRVYDCYGLLLGKFLFDEKGGKEVGRDTPSFIKPFATTAMVNTFVMGFSPGCLRAGMVRDSKLDPSDGGVPSGGARLRPARRSSSVLKNVQVSAEQGINGRKSGVYTQ